MEVVGGAVVDGEGAPWFNDVGVVVGGGATVVEVLGGEVVGTTAGVVAEDVLAPGCSFATTTPMATVPPVASRMANPVRRRSRAAARSLVSGELACGEELIRVRRSASANRSRGEQRYAECSLWICAESVLSLPRSEALTPMIRGVVRVVRQAGQVSLLAPYEGGITPT